MCLSDSVCGFLACLLHQLYLSAEVSNPYVMSPASPLSRPPRRGSTCFRSQATEAVRKWCTCFWQVGNRGDEATEAVWRWLFSRCSPYPKGSNISHDATTTNDQAIEVAEVTQSGHHDHWGVGNEDVFCRSIRCSSKSVRDRLSRSLAHNILNNYKYVLCNSDFNSNPQLNRKVTPL